MSDIREGKGYMSGLLALSNDSVPKMLLVTVVLCLVCSVLVSGAAVYLRPLQAKNVEMAKRTQILEVAGLMQPDGDVDELFAAVDARMVDLATGEYSDDVDAATFDMDVASRDPVTSVAIPTEQDVAGIGRRARYGAVYLVREDERIETIVLPVKGYGLWSTMYGFLALEGDARTVKGITFFQHGETPGLGGEIENPRWQAKWPGKKVYDEAGELRLHVVKGELRPGTPGADYAVDGISGATLTANGVSRMIQYWLGEQGYGPYLERLREAGETT